MRIRSLGLVFASLSCAVLAGCSGGGTPTPPVTPPSITTTSPLTQGTTGTAYSTTLSVTGGTAPYTWTLTSGNLPAGLTLSAAGVISGTPTAAGTTNFTVQVADAESTPKTATAPLTLAISGGAVITVTTPPPNGIVGVAYSFQLAATGGIPPYTWSSSGTLPPGLTLSSAGLLSGTPTAAGTFSPAIKATDSTNNNSGSLTVPITISAATGSLPNGFYSFVFSGTNAQNAPVAINGYFGLANGQEGFGYYDENTAGSAPLLNQAIVGGSAIATSNGLGTLQLMLTSTNTITFSYASPTSIGTSGNDSDIRIIEFDDTTGKAMRGSGVLKFQSGPGDISAIQGSYAFRLSGLDSSGNPDAIAGSFVFDGKGNITSGKADMNDNGKVTNIGAVTGSYTITASAPGRGTINLNLNGNSYNYTFDQVSPGELLAISADQTSSTIPLVSGSILQQTGAPFSNASLKGVSALELNGLASVSGSTTPDLTLGLATTDGNGNVSVSYDEFKSLLLPSQSFTGTYSVDPVTGRVAFTSAGTPSILYLVSTNEAFVLGGDASASSGLLEPQSGSPFANATFKGSYLGGSFALASPAVTNEVGQAVADGAGNLVVTSNSSGPKGLVTKGVLNGTYVVDSHGRAVVTASDGLPRIFYLVSPTKVAFLSGADGYIGSFEQ